jgi:hypothetical protein
VNSHPDKYYEDSEMQKRQKKSEEEKAAEIELDEGEEEMTLEIEWEGSEKIVRPGSVTFISWVTIVISFILFFISLIVLEKLGRRDPVWPLLIVFSIAVLNLVAGIGLLQGRNWARLLYCWGNGLIILLFTFGLIEEAPSRHLGRALGQSALSVIPFIVFVILLYTARAQRYFLEPRLERGE